MLSCGGGEWAPVTSGWFLAFLGTSLLELSPHRLLVSDKEKLSHVKFRILSVEGKRV